MSLAVRQIEETNLGTQKLLSQTDFARRHKLSLVRVKKLIAEGLPLKAGKVPVAAAEEWLSANVDSSRQNNWAGDLNLNELRRQREQIKVVAGKIALAKARGDLVEQVEVTKFLSARARLERDSWMAWSSAAAGRLAAALAVDHGRLFTALECEVRLHLQHLSETPLQDQEKEKVE
jgi:hypothetical protein